MKHVRGSEGRPTRRAQQSPLAPEVVSLLFADALSQSYAAGQAIERFALPHVPALKRGPVLELLRKLNGSRMFEDRFLRDLESFMATLEENIEAGTQRYWQADECHFAGGYERTISDSEAQAFYKVLREAALLRDQLVDVASSSRALGMDATSL